jgi:Mg2+ transporter (mgtE)
MKKLTTTYFEELLEAQNYKEIKELFELYPEIDIAEIVNRTQVDDAKKIISIFRVVKSEHTSIFFSELDKEHQEALIKLMSDKDVAELIAASSNDDITDFIVDMPANLVNKVLKNTSKEDRTIINKLLNYKEDSAGSIMTTEYLEFLNTTSIHDSIEKIRELGKNAETIYTIFVKDSKRNFLGTVDLDDLIFAKPDEKLDDIMNKDFVTVDVNTDQEAVAELVRRYDLNAIAVLNDDKRLIGIITVDDIIDVIQKEANEDLSLQAGIVPLENSYKDTGVFKMAFKCIPWLCFLLVLDVFSSIALSGFQNQLATMAVLAAFIPTIMDTGGNAGSQTSSVMVRSIALNEFGPKDFFKILWKELRISSIVAIITSFFAFLWFLAEMYLNLVVYPTNIADLSAGTIFAERSGIAGLVAITLFFTILISKLFGCILPLVAKSIKKDPALMSGPLITSIVDVTSILIYFGIFELIGNIFHVFGM